VKHFETSRAHFGRDEAATMVEFAVSLPLLLVLVVGIYDFGGAFNLKQELNNAVREGARYGASSSTADLSQTGIAPPTVAATAILVDSYLQTARLNDCGLNSVVTTGTATFSSPLTWTYTASGCSYGNLTLTIQRGFSKAAGAVASTNIQVIYTQVSIQYPYQWQFNRVIQLLVSGASYVGTSLISTSATVPNVF
jgi:Flp pilus assembly protein TadG